MTVGGEQLLVGILSLVLGGIAVYFPMRSKHKDELDARVLEETRLRSQDTKTALEAWQAIVTVHSQTIADQAKQILELRKRADDCDEVNGTLRAELALLRE